MVDIKWRCPLCFLIFNESPTNPPQVDPKLSLYQSCNWKKKESQGWCLKDFRWKWNVIYFSASRIAWASAAYFGMTFLEIFWEEVFEAVGSIKDANSHPHCRCPKDGWCHDHRPSQQQTHHQKWRPDTLSCGGKRCYTGRSTSVSVFSVTSFWNKLTSTPEIVPKSWRCNFFKACGNIWPLYWKNHDLTLTVCSLQRSLSKPEIFSFTRAPPGNGTQQPYQKFSDFCDFTRESGDKVLQKPYLPPHKQYLITRNGLLRPFFDTPSIFLFSDAQSFWKFVLWQCHASSAREPCKMDSVTNCWGLMTLVMTRMTFGYPPTSSRKVWVNCLHLTHQTFRVTRTLTLFSPLRPLYFRPHGDN